VCEFWHGTRPLAGHEVIVQAITAATTATGLRVRAELDTSAYDTGVKVSDRQMDALPLTRHDWHGAWNLCVTGHRFHYAGAGIMGRGTGDRGNVAGFEGIRTA
jgi:Rhodopirellula transposase DDE domain